MDPANYTLDLQGPGDIFSGSNTESENRNSPCMWSEQQNYPREGSNPAKSSEHGSSMMSEQALTADNSAPQNVSVEADTPFPQQSTSMLLNQLLLAPIGSTREVISQNAHQLVEDINAKRKQDTQLLADFRKAVMMQSENMVSVVQQHLFQLYEVQGNVISDKLRELFTTLDRIATTESELQQFRQALTFLYQDLQ